jgi:hypothetical protein
MLRAAARCSCGYCPCLVLTVPSSNLRHRTGYSYVIFSLFSSVIATLLRRYVIILQSSKHIPVFPSSLYAIHKRLLISRSSLYRTILKLRSYTQTPTNDCEVRTWNLSPVDSEMFTFWALEDSLHPVATKLLTVEKCPWTPVRYSICSFTHAVNI